MNITVSQLAEKIGAIVVGDGGAVVSSIHTLEEAAAGQVSFLSNPKYEKLLETTQATAVIASKTTRSRRVTILRCDDPYYAFMQAMVLLHGHRKHPHVGVHPQARVDPSAKVGDGCVIYPGAYVGPRAVLGKQCILYPNAVVYDDCVLHDRVTLHAGAVIGQDGFGYATHGGVHHKIPQAGIVELHDDVEIGANVTIQRAALGKTVIGAGTKISDLAAIGHGADIGPHGLIVSLAGIAGSTHIGHHLTIGGQAGVAGHLSLGDHVTIAARAGVIADAPDRTVLYGAPATPAPHGRRAVTIAAQLPELVDRIRELEKQVADLLAKQGKS
ncbi:MAG TPA: UDP-3-O-(3-hydroxymyristoyl)glucosamine N-acyltransferase [Tepidisphaeraceae bacterium]|jgi:UDP-3-O-[3-hydroxymyristoyl] glucosamine N-acyltransferase|nr:UDP-3-O-(3-hydroxymyristoyl)glucosamine N-acyltransferase [Tepidisphaeraceae bacterium]